MTRFRRLVLGLIVIAILATLTLPWWKPVTDRTKWGIVAAHLAHNMARRVGLARGQIDDSYTAARSETELPSTLARIDTTFQQYVEYGGLTPEVVSGAHVLEVGPGNTIATPLLFISRGAARATALDKFVPLQDSPFHRRLYSQMRDRLDPAEKERFDAAIRIGDRLELVPERLEYVFGRGIEEGPFPASTFDIVVSNAVLMEVYDADATFATFDRVLKPGGRMAHVIDLRDYTMFPKHGFHHLEFLTIPDTIYRNMADSIGQPNRRLVDYYRNKMASLGYEATIHITEVIGAPQQLKVYKTALRRGVDYGDDAVAMVNQIRPRLLERYRNLPDEDLLTAGILLVARKPRTR